MRKLIAIATVFFTMTCIGQEFTGKATYKTSRKSSFKIDTEKNKGMSEDMQKQIQERLQKMNQKTYILSFDKNSSTYKQQAKLNAPQPNLNGGMMRVVSIGGGSGENDVYYKNLKKQRFSEKTEIMGKSFLIKDELPKYEWELSSETKNIGNYVCYKATFSREVENKNISMVNGETKEEIVKKTVVTTAWYTPQIPVSNGPDNFQGLPGLILEINDGTNLIVCTEIVLNPSEKIKISKPEKGKVVSQKEFDEIQEKKSKEMMERFKSRNGVDLGNGVNIKIGG